MKKIILILTVALLSVVEIHANRAATLPSELTKTEAGGITVGPSDEEILQPLKPTFVAGAVVSSWRDNWFRSVSGGAAAFIGSPIGCDDLFGRVKLTLQISLGKWHTPSIGTRLVFQGFEWKGGELTTQRYRHYHADLLWNVVSSENRWSVVPFIGLGLVDNRTARTQPFAINYGIMGRFRIAPRLHFTAEISNATAFKDADGFGSPRQFGDNLLSFAAGFSVTIGRHAGWRKVVDARPYIAQNERLMARDHAHRVRIRQLERQLGIDARLLAELRKILDIEGLLDKYAARLAAYAYESGDSLLAQGYPVNDYSGLNSLRRRLREAQKIGDKNLADSSSDAENSGLNRQNGCGDSADSGNNSEVSIGNAAAYGDSVNSLLSNPDAYPDTINGAPSNVGGYPDNGSGDTRANYWTLIGSSGDCLGAPIYFFFELGTTNLVDESQTVNLNEIARVAGKYGLRIVVTGAADSATGTTEINSDLGSRRASFIANYLAANGIPSANITTRSVGGIATYTPNEANRNAAVRLYLPPE